MNRQNHDEDMLSNLPTEQDRKATIGCLAAALNIMFSHQRREVMEKKEKEEGNDGAISGQKLNMSMCQDGESVVPSWAPNLCRRKKEFQKELLNMSAGLLFLSPDHATVFVPNLDIRCTDNKQEHQLLLEPFLQSMSSAQESFRCIALLMFRFLLLSSESESESNSAKKTIVGYDARVRFAFKYLAVSVLSYWELQQQHGLITGSSQESAEAHATRKFEALEDGMASRLTLISRMMREKAEGQEFNDNKKALAGQNRRKSFGQHVVRGLKIGTAGIAAGTVFAITGGLAAPAIAGGIVALTGAGAVTSFAITLLMIPAATTVFGVAGGGIVASKMSIRTKGLSEFAVNKVNPDRGNKEEEVSGKDRQAETFPELSRTICISGWLTDEHDFQRPFGTTPESLTDKHELLCRFCSIYAPYVVPKCREILNKWEGKEGDLWELLHSAYGKDPDSLLPLSSGPRQDGFLSRTENEAVDGLIRTIGLPMVSRRDEVASAEGDAKIGALLPPVNLLADVLTNNNDATAAGAKSSMNGTALRSYKVWDFHAEYGGEQYTISWEKDLLIQLNGSAKDFQKDLAKTAAEEALKKTALASLLAAVALPATLLSFTNIIDEKWTLVAERADEAGILLAHSLLDSEAGHRPVSLVGFSFGARMILSCLEELARHQNTWMQQGMSDDDRGLTNATSFRKRLAGKQEEATYSREPASIIEDVIIMGCPASKTPSSWVSCRQIVGGRLVNCFSKNDLMLALMYRMKNPTQILSPPVGIREADATPGIENYDVSSLVTYHAEYCVVVRDILDMVGYDQPRKSQAKSDEQ
uniref:DUF726 domain-containing protein n=1 Tax=Odontella aurita TaxID=265563 RepID=A0A7S4IC55_9STRA|mmetsp:Transcript_23015/g.67887  ORF Transcript_23015/g.67887 Transcript_23015/m.67887 type:complete len:813 (+) Transcript_23015:87-2525(+)